MSELSVLVTSCDKNEDLWNPFFKLLNKNWTDLEFPIILNTETKSFSYENLNIKTYSVAAEKSNMMWSERLIENIKQIDSKYILILIEDFFLQGPVKTDIIKNCIKWMDSNKHIACFNFMPLNGGKGEHPEYKDFEMVGKKAPYRINLQAAIWRKEFLLKFLRKHESPWYLETWGSLRSRRYKDEIYTFLRDREKVFKYDAHLGVTLGKWEKREVIGFFKDNGIEIDFEKRGFLGDTLPEPYKRKPFLVRCYNVFKSLI